MRLFLAGAENPEQLKPLVEYGAPYILLTYWYMRKQGDKGLKVLTEARDSGAKLIVDSGAFSFKDKYVYLWRTLIKNHTEDGVTRNEEWITQAEMDEKRHAAGNKRRQDVVLEMRAYWREYREWLYEFSHLFETFAELDLDGFIDEEIWEWREELAADIRLGRIKAEPIVTSHYYAEAKDLTRLADMGFSYFGVSRGAWREDYFTQWMPFFRERKIRTHGWAMTDKDKVLRQPFYSVDSTTWLGAARYGSTYIYNGGLDMTTIPYTDKQRRKNYRKIADKYNIDFEAFLKEDVLSMNRFMASQWIEYARDLESYVTNSYWLDDAERGEIVAEARAQWGTDSVIQRHTAGASEIAAYDLNSLKFARLCNTCFLNAKCPAFSAGASCSVSQLMRIDSGADVADAAKMLLALQVDRAAFAAFAEKIQGTPGDEIVSKELDRALAMMKTIRDIGSPTESVTIQAKGPGILSQIFGRK